MHQPHLHRSALFIAILMSTQSLQANSDEPLQGETESASDESSSVETLEKITVTAQRREQGLRDVPISVASIPAEKISSLFSGGESVLALSSQVPGLYAESSNGRAAPRFYIRGLGNSDFDLAASQPVSIIMDGVVMENVVLKSFPLFDIDSIEVSRGPQGTLFGRNTTAGIINFNTRRPEHFSEGYVRTSAGNLNSSTVEGAFGGSLIDDTLAGRLSIFQQNRGDWITNDFENESDALGGFTEQALRGQLLWTPNESFSALLSAQARDLDGTSSVFYGTAINQGDSKPNSSFDRDRVSFDGGNNNPQTYDGAGYTLTLDWYSDNYTLTSITSYQHADGLSRGDIDGTSIYPVDVAFPSVTEDRADVSQLTQEFRIASSDLSSFRWQSGLFFFDSDLDVGTTSFASEVTDDDGNVTRQDALVNHTNTSWAVFGQGEYDFSAKTTLTAGLRYTYDEKAFRLKQLSALGAVIGQQVDPVDLDDDHISWDIALNHKLNKKSSIFARVASGFRAQSIQGRDVGFLGSASTADSEKILSYEVGYKADLLDNRLRLNTAAFYYDLDDIQLTAVGGNNNSVGLLNADSGTGYGIEADIEFLPVERLSLTAGYSYNHTEIKDNDLQVAACGSAQCTVLDPTSVVNGADGNPITLAAIDGNSFNNAPEQTLNVSAHYWHPVKSGELYAYTDWAVTGDTQIFLYESEEYNTSSQFEGGLRLGYINHEKSYEVGLYGRNITDEVNIKGGVDFNNNTIIVNEPRTYGIDFRVNF